MTGDILVGLDAGTSVIKSVAFSTAGKPLAEASVVNAYEYGPHGAVEQGMAATWTRAAQTLHQLADKIPGLPQRIAAIAVTGQGDGTWLIDRDGGPVAPAWLWLDSRAAARVEELRARPDDERRFALTGTGLAACHQGPQLACMPDAALARAATAFHCKDWLYFKLTGERATDPSEAALSFGDFRSRTYSEEVIDILGVRPYRHLLPEIRDGADHRGHLSPEAAGLIGLRAGTPVVLGYIDIVCSALGAGIADRTTRAGCSIIGSTGMHMQLATSADEVRLTPQRTGYTLALPAPGCYARTQSNLAGSVNLDWLVALIGESLTAFGCDRSRQDVLARLDGLMQSGEAPRLLFHPFITEAGERGPFLDAHARAGLIGLSQGHGLADLVRAVVEGVCFAARDCYAAIGERPAEIRLCGGVARSPAFCALLASVLQAPVRCVGREEAGAAGAAMIAAVALGIHRDLESCTAEWVTPLLQAPYEPDAGMRDHYDFLFETYRQSCRALQPVWRELGRTT